jgi:hypothetical protein
MPPSYLARHYDPALAVEKVGPRETLEKGEIERLQRAMTVVLFAGSIPRRIGDASDEELALDKKRSRRVLHALNQSFRGWTKATPYLEATKEIKAEGAVINWVAWREEHLTIVRHRLRVLTTWAVRAEEEAWGKQVVVKLENEIGWIEYALRD